MQLKSIVAQNSGDDWTGVRRACDGVDVVFHQHQRRKTNFKLGKSLGKQDHVVIWPKPACPEWMDQATCERMPETLFRS